MSDLLQNPQIHPLADVQSLHIGGGTRIWQFVVILPGARIGADGNICLHCFIENDVVIGDRVTVKSGVQLWDGTTLEDDVFVGSNVTFTNDRYPRSRAYPERFLTTLVCRGASIGGGAVILPGLIIDAGAMIGAGAVVTKSVPKGRTVHGLSRWHWPIRRVVPGVLREVRSEEILQMHRSPALAMSARLLRSGPVSSAA